MSGLKARRSPGTAKGSAQPAPPRGLLLSDLKGCSSGRRCVRGRGRQFPTAARLPSFPGDASGSPLPGRQGGPWITACVPDPARRIVTRMGRDALPRLGWRARQRPELEPGPGWPGRAQVLLSINGIILYETRLYFSQFGNVNNLQNLILQRGTAMNNHKESELQNSERFARQANIISIISVAIAVGALCLTAYQMYSDKTPKVVVASGILPIKEIPDKSQVTIPLELLNTSKVDVRYLLKADSNMGEISGEHGRPQLIIEKYESRTNTLTNADGGRNNHNHTLTITTRSGAVPMTVLATQSEPDYYLRLEIIDDKSGDTLFKHECFYVFLPDKRSFVLHEPVFDTSGESTLLQENCTA